MDLILYLGYVALLLIIALFVQLFRLILADGDLTLLWASRNPCLEQLAGKVIWITGASSGIGEHLCYALAQSNCKLVLSARQQNELERVKKNLIEKHHFNENNVQVLPLDVLNFSAHKTAFDTIISNFGQLDILVNNAGRSQRCELVDTPLDVDKAIMEMNWLSPIALTKTVLPHFISRRQGHVVVTSSVAGKIAAPFSSSYCAAKHAVQGWFDTARVELAHHNIHVTSICAGPIYSNIQNNAFTSKLGEKYGVDQAAGSCMSTERCAYLMTTAIAAKLKEVWISKHPVLAMTYLAQYAPDITKRILIKVGLKEVLKLRKVKPQN